MVKVKHLFCPFSLWIYLFSLFQPERGDSAQSHSPPHSEPATISPTPSEEKAALSSLTSIHDVIQVINLQKVRHITFEIIPFTPDFLNWTLPSLSLSCPLLKIGVSAKNRKQNGKQCRSWWDGLLQPSHLELATLFAKVSSVPGWKGKWVCRGRPKNAKA